MKRAKKTSIQPSLVVGGGVAFIVLLAGGLSQRWLEAALIAADNVPIALQKPLSTIPVRLGQWEGVDIPIDKRVIEVAGCDDYVSRRYTEAGTGRAVDLYVSYAARPAKMLGHRPEVCYRTHGWTHVSTRKDRISPAGGDAFECLMHRFTKNDLMDQSVVILNYYLLRGQYATDWTKFWGPTWRLPNLSRDPTFYVAQVQVSTPTDVTVRPEEAEALIKAFTAEIAPLVRELLPEPEMPEKSE